ncbi:MAG: ABC transporter permease, partial [Gemmatimonadaceae bacterium]
MRNDLRDAIRALRRAPAFSVVAILMLALAIGSATATFSVVDAILVRGLPYANAARLQAVYERSDDGALRVPSYPTFEDWQANGPAVRDAIDGFAFVRGNVVFVGTSAEPDQQIAAYVTPGFFQLIGTRPMIGRSFSPDDERPGSPRVAVISHDFFIRHFGGNAEAALGKTVSVDSVQTTVIGVMPRGFAYPNFGGIGWVPPALWQPIAVFDATHAALRLRGLHVDSRALLRLHAG